MLGVRASGIKDAELPVHDARAREFFAPPRMFTMRECASLVQNCMFTTRARVSAAPRCMFTMRVVWADTVVGYQPDLRRTFGPKLN